MTKLNTLKYKEGDNGYLKKILEMKNKDIEKVEETYRKQQFRIIGGLTTVLISFINRNNWFLSIWSGCKFPILSEKSSNLILSIITSKVFNYSLKSIGKSLFNQQLIHTKWEEDIGNGLDAMV